VSGEGAENRPPTRVRSSGTKARTRAGASRSSLERKLNARERELAESLEHLEATSDILRVISNSPTDLQAIFDMIAANALRLCGALFSVVLRFDGNLLELASFHNLLDPQRVEAIRQAFPRSPSSRLGATDQAILTRAILTFRM
jgi:two-component system, NtrC family, sensor kinase